MKIRNPGARSSSAGTAGLVALVFAAGCYEAKPQLQPGYVGGPARSGWPPAAAYAPDPFHPANRLFQRLYVLRAEGPVAGSASPSQTDLPISPRETLGAVDRAEVSALLKVLAGGGEDGFGSISPPALRWVLASDLTALLARLSSRDRSDRAFLEDLARAALGAPGPAPPEPTPPPPPLRDGDWREDAGPPHPAFRPSAADLRWSRVFRREGESLLLRLRIAAGPAGESVLLPIGSEAWHLSAAKGSPPAARLYHLKREKLARGADPWEEAPPGSMASIRDPEDPSRPALSGKLPALCAGCHPGPGLEARGPSARPPAAPPPAPEASAGGPAPESAQREDAWRALAGIPWGHRH